MSQISFLVLMASLTLVVCDRPIYNIAHMINSVKQIDTWLGSGYEANALEADTKFHWNGKPAYFYHGPVCDAGRDCERWAYIKNYVNALRDRTMPSSQQYNSRLALVMFDCKLSTSYNLTNAGIKFVEDILAPLYQDNPTRMKVMMSVPNLGLSTFIRSVITTLQRHHPSILQKIGWEISWESNSNNLPRQLEAGLRAAGVQAGHAWLSRGISASLATDYSDELRRDVTYRDTNSGHFFSKVYTWTVDTERNSLRFLKLNLDGIITNKPWKVNNAITRFNNEKKAANQAARVRLATLDDSPFERYNPSSSAKSKKD